MIFQFVSFSALQAVASGLNYLFQYFASLKLDSSSFSQLMALMSIMTFFGILSTIFRNQFAILFFESNFSFTEDLKKIYKQINLSVFLLLLAFTVYSRTLPVFLTSIIIFFSISAAPLIGMLQAKKDYHRIALLSLAGAISKILLVGLLIPFAIKWQTNTFLLILISSSVFAYILTFQTSTHLPHEGHSHSLKLLDKTFSLSLLGTLTMAMINSFDSVIFIRVLNVNESGIFGKYILLGKVVMVGFEMLIFTLFPYFIEGNKVKPKTIFSFLLISAFIFFFVDFFPSRLIEFVLTKVFHDFNFEFILFKNYWKQIVVVGLSSILVNYMMARKRFAPLLICLMAALSIILFVTFHPTDLQNFVDWNKKLMEGFFLLVTVFFLWEVKKGYRA